MNQHHVQFLSDALRAMVHMKGSAAKAERAQTELRALEARLSHERDIFGLRTDLMRDLIRALIEQRVDAISNGFLATLAMYAEESRDYLGEKNRHTDAIIKATNPSEVAHLRSRLREIDLQLTSIRSDGEALHREMTRAILLIGGTMPVMSKEDQRALAIVTTK